MTDFLAFVLLVLNIIVLSIMVGLRRRVDNLRADQSLILSRLDAIRGEPKKTPAPTAMGTTTAQPAPVAVPTPPVTAPPAAVPPVLPKTPAPVPMRVQPLTPPPAAVIPPAPSKFVESTREILGKIWNWVLVGEEHRRPGVSAEYAIGSTWLLRLGILAVVACVIYFLKWSVEQGILGPQGRVALSMFVGIGLLAWGMRLIGHKYHIFGQGFLGGGLLSLYFSAFAAGSRHHIVDQPIAFGIMALITVAAGLLAVRTESLLVAILGLAGGYLTPVMLRTPTPNLPALYAYILLLSLGILGVARVRSWRLLNYLGFAATYVLFWGSLRAYQPATDFPLAMTFLSLFFVIHSFIIYIHNIVRQKPTTTLDVIHLVANALAFAATAYHLIESRYGRPFPCIMAISLGVFYIVHVLVFIRRKVVDRPLLIALIALAGGFTTWALPLLMEKESLTIALSLLALVFLWIGRRMGNRFLEQLSYLLYMAVFYRLLWMDIPRNFTVHPERTSIALSAYWHLMAARLWTFGVSIASVFAAFWIQRQRTDPAAPTVAGTNDIGAGVPRTVASHFFYWIAILFLFAVVHLELNTLFAYFQPFRLPVLTVLWCGMATYFLARHMGGAEPQPLFLAAAWIFCVGALFKLFSFDLQSWHLCPNLFFDMEYSPFLAGMRLLDFGVVILFLVVAWRWVARQSPVPASVFGYLALALFFIYASLETNSALHWKLPAFQRGGISILWALFAVAFLSVGIGRNLRGLRYTGLILFAVVAAKVFLIDFSHTTVILRVIAFMAVGIALLLGSFAYVRSGRNFGSTEEENG